MVLLEIALLKLTEMFLLVRLGDCEIVGCRQEILSCLLDCMESFCVYWSNRASTNFISAKVSLGLVVPMLCMR